jgi:hypothetical protein
MALKLRRREKALVSRRRNSVDAEMKKDVDADTKKGVDAETRKGVDAEYVSSSVELSQLTWRRDQRRSRDNSLLSNVNCCEAEVRSRSYL